MQEKVWGLVNGKGLARKVRRVKTGTVDLFPVSKCHTCVIAPTWALSEKQETGLLSRLFEPRISG
jgi:hypothetical protein